MVSIRVPEEVRFEQLDLDAMRDWDAENTLPSRAFGDRRLNEKRTAVLRVRSVVLRGRELSLVLNPAHPDLVLILAWSGSPRWRPQTIQQTEPTSSLSLWGGRACLVHPSNVPAVYDSNVARRLLAFAQSCESSSPFWPSSDRFGRRRAASHTFRCETGAMDLQREWRHTCCINGN